MKKILEILVAIIPQVLRGFRLIRQFMWIVRYASFKYMNVYYFTNGIIYIFVFSDNVVAYMFFKNNP